MTTLNIHQRTVKPPLEVRPCDARVGLVILATDHTTEPDYARMVASKQIGVYVARLAYANPTTPENLRAMQPALSAAAGLILPGEDLDVLCYSCNSASVVIGDDAVAAAFQASKPGVAVVTPPLATLKALQALSARRISILTPYLAETSAPVAAYFAKSGFEVASFTCLGMDDDREMARIAPETLVELAREAMDPQADALIVLCTALRAAEAAADIEAALGKPVVTSNQATAWMCLRLCGDDRAMPERGQVFTLPLAAP
ncbi:ectoine utilization protein EutA [Aquamicrobium segne]|uniref:Ectoine utilization protein EutA n=1 Tax=Aquamicrobium segne TaxID=469547 RepID=A0ABW0GV68_9HYPH